MGIRMIKRGIALAGAASMAVGVLAASASPASAKTKHHYVGPGCSTTPKEIHIGGVNGGDTGEVHFTVSCHGLSVRTDYDISSSDLSFYCRDFVNIANDGDSTTITADNNGRLSFNVSAGRDCVPAVAHIQVIDSSGTGIRAVATADIDN